MIDDRTSHMIDLKLRSKVLKFITRYPRSPVLLESWLPQPYTHTELEIVLVVLRDEGLIACTNGMWWRRRSTHAKIPV